MASAAIRGKSEADAIKTSFATKDLVFDSRDRLLINGGAGLNASLSINSNTFVHVVCHGTVTEDHRPVLIAKTGTMGLGEKWIDANDFAARMPDSCELIFLNACLSGAFDEKAETTHNDFPYRLLASNKTTHVLCNAKRVSDNDSVAFAKVLYSSVAAGRSLTRSIWDARDALMRNADGLSITWHIPILYVKDVLNKRFSIPDGVFNERAPGTKKAKSWDDHPAEFERKCREAVRGRQVARAPSSTASSKTKMDHIPSGRQHWAYRCENSRPQGSRSGTAGFV